jgi:pheromone shutdown protein TraB
MEQLDPALEEARRAGIDLDLIDSNLALTVEQRWKQHDAALELALMLETAGKIRDARLQSIASASR